MFKRFFVALTLSLSCALLLAGCGSSETTTNGSNQTSSNKTTTTTTTTTPATTTTTTTTPATTTTTPATTTASGGKIGVAECDDFIDKYEACITGKVPEAARAQWNSALQTWRTQWKQLADNPQTRGSLAAACKMAADQSRQSMKPYGCDF